MPSHSGRSWPARASRTVLVLALTICLLAMHSLMGALPSSGTTAMRAVVAVPAATSVVPNLAVSLTEGQSGSGSMVVSGMEDCAAVLAAFGFPLLASSTLEIESHLSEPTVRRPAVVADSRRPPIPQALGVLRI